MTINQLCPALYLCGRHLLVIAILEIKTEGSNSRVTSFKGNSSKPIPYDISNIFYDNNCMIWSKTGLARITRMWHRRIFANLFSILLSRGGGCICFCTQSAVIIVGVLPWHHTKPNKRSFLKGSSRVQSETMSMNFSYSVTLKSSVPHCTLSRSFYPSYFVTSYISQLENTGTLSYSDLPHFDTFHYITSKHYTR